MGAYDSFYAGSPIFTMTPSEVWTDDFNQNISDQFYNAFNVYSILEESPFGSGSMISPVDVRITGAIDSKTGAKLEDDYKIFLFQPDHGSPDIGDKFYFDKNYWLCVNTGKLKSIVANGTVRRASNVIKWIDSGSVIRTEPIIIEYDFSTQKNLIGDIVQAKNDMTIYCQQNSYTRKIQANQRFLFGNVDNYIPFHVRGGGIKNFINSETTNNNSAHLMELVLEADKLNSSDDLVNGIANRYPQTADSTTYLGLGD